jgi:hypothetical protein
VRARIRSGLANDHFGVIRVILTMHQSLPVYPEKQTIREPVSTSQKCQPACGESAYWGRAEVVCARP